MFLKFKHFISSIDFLQITPGVERQVQPCSHCFFFVRNGRLNNPGRGRISCVQHFFTVTLFAWLMVPRGSFLFMQVATATCVFLVYCHMGGDPEVLGMS